MVDHRKTPEGTPEVKKQYSEFVVDLAGELKGTALVYAKLAEEYCVKYPLLNKTDVGFTVNKLLLYCHAAGMLAVCRIDKKSSDAYMHEAIDLLMDRIHQYACDMIDQVEDEGEGAGKGEGGQR